MPHRRFDWHEHIRDVEGEYHATRAAVERLQELVIAKPDIVLNEPWNRAYLQNAAANIEGTFIVRLFAAFEAALRSYDRARHNDSEREVAASVLIDTIAGRRGQGISATLRNDAHTVRRVRNYWAHEDDSTPVYLSMVEARARLQRYLSWLPEEWGD